MQESTEPKSDVCVTMRKVSPNAGFCRGMGVCHQADRRLCKAELRFHTPFLQMCSYDKSEYRSFIISQRQT